mgnify:CR=1 FL=1
MKRIILYIGIVAALFVAPTEQLEVGKLIPVEAAAVYKQNASYVIETNTQNKGIGKTAQEALQNLKDTAAGIIYLDTAKYLLLTEETQDAVEILRENLKPSTQLCKMKRPVPMKEVAKFLDAHDKLPKLKHWKTGTELPVLSPFEDSYVFFEKSRK